MSVPGLMTGAMTRPPPHMKASSMSSVAASRGNSCHSGRTTCRPIRGEDGGHVTSCPPIRAHRAPGHSVVVEQRVEVGQQPVLEVVLGVRCEGTLNISSSQAISILCLHDLTQHQAPLPLTVRAARAALATRPPAHTPGSWS